MVEDGAQLGIAAGRHQDLGVRRHQVVRGVGVDVAVDVLEHLLKSERINSGAKDDGVHADTGYVGVSTIP